MTEDSKAVEVVARIGKREELENLAYDWGMYRSDGFIDAILDVLREPTEDMLKHQYKGPVISWQDTIDSIKQE